MHLTIVYYYANISCIATVKWSLLHSFHYTLQYCRHKTLVDSTSNNRVDKHELSAPFQINDFLVLDVHLELLTINLVRCRIRHTLSIRFDNEMNLTELSCTARLFFMTIISTCKLSDSFTIWNTWFKKFNLKLLVVFKSPFKCTQMELTLSVNDSLSELFTLLNDPCRIFLTHLYQCRHQLFSISLILCLYRTRIF